MTEAEDFGAEDRSALRPILRSTWGGVEGEGLAPPFQLGTLDPGALEPGMLLPSVARSDVAGWST